jgi:hypothetical protein
MFGTNSNAVAKTTASSPTAVSVAQPARQVITSSQATLLKYFTLTWKDRSNQQAYAKDKQGLVWCWSATEQLWRR